MLLHTCRARFTCTRSHNQSIVQSVVLAERPCIALVKPVDLSKPSATSTSTVQPGEVGILAPPDAGRGDGLAVAQRCGIGDMNCCLLVTSGLNRPGVEHTRRSWTFGRRRGCQCTHISLVSHTDLQVLVSAKGPAAVRNRFCHT